ncbi:MAG: hypothetical protein CMJ78_12545 [Planctomycetaceae bacterium]|nr:hypothetical protein [Planctomycetaceae bacterium]
MKLLGSSFLLLWALVWTAGVGAFDCIMGYQAFQQLRTSSFDSTDGKVTVSRAVAVDDDSTKLELAYTYRVGVVAFTGNQYRYDDMGSNDGYAEELAERLPVGTVVTVFYNPSDPNQAVLETGINGGNLFMALFLTPFNLIMLGSWYAVFASRENDEDEENPFPQREDEFDQKTYVNLDTASALIRAAGTLMGLCFFSIFIVGFTYGFHAPFGFMIAYWIGIVAITTFVWFHTNKKVKRGDYDLVLDPLERTVSIPPNSKRRRRTTIDVSDVKGIRLRSIYPKSDEERVEYIPTLIVDSEGESHERSIVVYYEEDKAIQLTEWFRDRYDLEGMTINDDNDFDEDDE